jgi:capsular exopolysaccharide synthesis family protein
MSRFFDTLQMAADSLLPESEPAGAAASEALQAGPVQAPTIPTDSEFLQSLDSAVASAAVPNLFPERAMPNSASGRNGAPPSNPLNVVLNPKTVLIPNAAKPVALEYYRRLRTKILQQHAAKSFPSLMVASPAPQEGKTATTVNLGLVFAMLPKFNVLVIDGDLRRGTLGDWLGASERPGFSDLLEGSATLDQVVCKSDQLGLHFVGRGKSERPPAELLQSVRLRSQLQSIAGYFNLVLVDSAPVNLVADAQLLAAGCDAVLMVARAFATTRKNFEKAVHDLQQYNIIGTILNGGTPSRAYGRYGYNGYHEFR